MISIGDDTVEIVPAPKQRRWRLLAAIIAVAVVVTVIVVLALTGRPGSELTGSGSTLAQPLVQRAAIDFRNAATADDPQNPDRSGTDWVLDGSGIDYEAVGSLGGIIALTDDRASFALADYPLSQQELDNRDIVQFPLIIGAIAVVTHPEVTGGAELRLDADTIADIYLGEITRWDDTRIAELNPDLDLPSLDIVPIHRSDGSGSTYGFTGYLDGSSSSWTLGRNARIEWPAGGGAEAEGSSGMIEAVAEQAGSIGYVDIGQAERADLPAAALRGADDNYASPDEDAIVAAIAGAAWSSAENFTTAIVDPAEAEGYPLTVAVYGMVKQKTGSLTNQVLSFMTYLLEESDEEARELGYVPLPENGAAAVRDYWTEKLNHK